MLTKFRGKKRDGYSLIQRSACNAARIAVEKFFKSNSIKRSSRGRLAKDGRRPRCRRPEMLLKNQHTIRSNASPKPRKGGKIYLPGIGEARLAKRLDLSDLDMRSYSITRKNGKLSLSACVFEPNVPKRIGGPIIGIDAGVKHAMAMSVQVDGANMVGFLDPPENARRHKNDYISKLYSERSKKKYNSRAWQKLTKLIRAELDKIANRAVNWERETAKLVSKAGRTIVVENLNLATMNRKKYNVAGSRNLHREMAYSKIGSAHVNMEWACEKNGGECVSVPPQYTSKKCCRCGNIDQNSRKSQSEFLCTKCGFECNADYGAAVNVSVLGGAAAGLAVIRCEDVAGLLRLLGKEPLENGRLLEHQKFHYGDGLHPASEEIG